VTLNESIVEDAALTWFLLRQGYGGQVWELGPQAREVGHLPAPRYATRQAGGPQMAPGESASERASFGVVVLAGRLRKAGKMTTV
jgi:hypothetical protein